MSGKYLVFDGIDGAGKSTLLSAVAIEFSKRNKSVETIRFPSERTVGKLIRDSMIDTNNVSPYAYMHLFAADGLDNENRIQSWLNEGKTILSDRHTISSGFVYQSDLYPIEAVLSVIKPGMFTTPTAFFILDVPSDVAISRINTRKGTSDIYETRKVQQIEIRRARYGSLWNIMQNVYTLDGTRPVHENVKTVFTVIDHIDALAIKLN